MPKETYIPDLLRLFRQYGYDGATLAKISEATGLGKASLYHHFPGGKDEMVATVLDYLERWMDENILQALKGTGDPLSRLQQMGDRVSEVYEGGKQPCLSAILLLGSARDVFHDRVQSLYQVWIEAIATVLIEAGLNKTVARQRGEDAVIAIQGALILSQGLNNPAPFQRVMQQLSRTLCENESSVVSG
ncbi:TetR/AcrR family transcriptional regulator [Leptolyngbya ohadii]|uniref:TetR/AcrR family transcriptional regulator n=1 Tax=Leptolyngbya ohadii TaxID=1962290 RepID=UPI000B5A1D52|nr:TetR/AcrR family transcriptional regulator [Leptolyngbya ohadii]